MDKSYLHIYLLVKLKQQTKIDIVDKEFLKTRIGRILYMKGGIPKLMIKYIIQDMVDMGLITCLNKREIYRLNSCKTEQRIKALLMI